MERISPTVTEVSEISALIREERLRRGLTQDELYPITGWSQPTVSRYERHGPPASAAREVAAFLGKSVKWVRERLHAEEDALLAIVSDDAEVRRLQAELRAAIAKRTDAHDRRGASRSLLPPVRSSRSKRS
jgi:transcriptional regulator with XRE-family HTH domain